jgi:hypothetical protein
MDDVGGGAGDLRNGVRMTSRIVFLVLIFSFLIVAMSFRLPFFRSDSCDRWALRRVALFDSGVLNRLIFFRFETPDFWIAFLEGFGGVVWTFAACDPLADLFIALEIDWIDGHASATKSLLLNRQGRGPSFYPIPNRSITRL